MNSSTLNVNIDINISFDIKNIIYGLIKILLNL